MRSPAEEEKSVPYNDNRRSTGSGYGASIRSLGGGDHVVSSGKRLGTNARGKDLSRLVSPGRCLSELLDVRWFGTELSERRSNPISSAREPCKSSKDSCAHYRLGDRGHECLGR